MSRVSSDDGLEPRCNLTVEAGIAPGLSAILSKQELQKTGPHVSTLTVKIIPVKEYRAQQPGLHDMVKLVFRV